jgi:hypothetical protein
MKSTFEDAVDVVQMTIRSASDSFSLRNRKIKFNLSESTECEQLLKHLTEFRAKKDAILADRNLSAEGQRNELGAAQKALFGTITAWQEKHVRAWDVRIAQEAAAFMRPAPRSTDALELLRQEIRDAEIRRQLLTVDPVLIPLVYAEGTPEIRGAMERAPAQIHATRKGELKIQPLIDPTVVQEQAVRQAEADNPDAALQLQELRAARGVLDGLANTVKASLRNEAGASLGDESVDALVAAR